MSVTKINVKIQFFYVLSPLHLTQLVTKLLKCSQFNAHFRIIWRCLNHLFQLWRQVAWLLTFESVKIWPMLITFLKFVQTVFCLIYFWTLDNTVIMAIKLKSFYLNFDFLKQRPIRFAYRETYLFPLRIKLS